jgi:hypothetical protein
MRLQVRFDRPGMMLNSPRLVVRVDGESIYDGSFRDGFVAAVEVAPGTHGIETSIELAPGLARLKRFSITMPASEPGRAPGLEARLQYSRLWGNFSDKLDVRRIDGDPAPR